MDIGAIGLLGAVTVFMVLIVVLLNRRIDDLKGDINALQDGQKSLQDGQVKLIASVAWLMARAGATPEEVASLYQDPPSDDD